MNDRFVRGIIAGSLAYLPTWIYNHTAHNYHFAKIRFVDFSAIMILGAPAKTNWEIWFTRFGTMFFLSLCGALFVFLIPQISSRYFMIKGWYFAVSLWFLIFSVTKLFKVEGLSKLDLKSAVSNFIAASIWGLVTADILRLIDKREKSVP